MNMKKLLILLLSIFLIIGCTSDSLTPTTQTADAKANVERGKPTSSEAIIMLTPTAVNTNPVGRIVNQPEDYFGVLPNNFNDPVDFDGDGNNDVVIFTRQTYNTPPSISVDGTVINYNIQGMIEINGFVDVNGDGNLDIITLGGIPYCYDTDPVGTRTYWAEGVSYVKGQRVYVDEGGSAPRVYVCQVDNLSTAANKPNAQSTIWRVPYGVAYGVDDKYPLTTEEILSSMVVTQMDKNPTRIKWDLSEYGYNCYTFYLWLREAEPSSGDYVFGTTGAYGEFGYHISNAASNSNKIAAGTLLQMRFSKGWYLEQTFVDIQF